MDHQPTSERLKDTGSERTQQILYNGQNQRGQGVEINCQSFVSKKRMTKLSDNTEEHFCSTERDLLTIILFGQTISLVFKMLLV